MFGGCDNHVHLFDMDWLIHDDSGELPGPVLVLHIAAPSKRVGIASVDLIWGRPNAIGDQRHSSKLFEKILPPGQIQLNIGG